MARFDSDNLLLLMRNLVCYVIKLSSRGKYIQILHADSQLPAIAVKISDQSVGILEQKLVFYQVKPKVAVDGLVWEWQFVS